jgi:hypothetical protein
VISGGNNKVKMQFDLPDVLKKTSTIDENVTVLSSNNTVPPRSESPQESARSFIVHEEQYYAIRPQRNQLYCLLEDLRNYRGVTLQNLGREIDRREIR